MFACMISRSVMSSSLRPHGLQPARFLCPWNSPGKNTGVGCHFLLQGIFLTQGLNPCLLHLCVFIYINHFAVQQKSAQHCGSNTIKKCNPQKKKKSGRSGEKRNLQELERILQSEKGHFNENSHNEINSVLLYQLLGQVADFTGVENLSQRWCGPGNSSRLSLKRPENRGMPCREAAIPDRSQPSMQGNLRKW